MLKEIMRQEQKRHKSVLFVEHIERHLEKMFDYPASVMCKICDKTIDEIYEEMKNG